MRLLSGFKTFKIYNNKNNSNIEWTYMITNHSIQRLRWSRSSVRAFGTQVRGFKLGVSRRIYQGEKILSTPSFGREVKQFVPCRRFAACKRSLNVAWKSGIFRQNSSAIFRPSSSSPLLGSLVETPGGASRKD